eukprot:s3299_g10.t1
MNIDVPVCDDRRIFVVANGLSWWHGTQQPVDATIVSPVMRAGGRGAFWRRGCHLAPVARRQRASDVQAAMRAAARAAWVARWSGLLAVAAQRAVAASLLELPLAGECNVAGKAPELHEVLTDVQWQPPTIGSRQGPR